MRTVIPIDVENPKTRLSPLLDPDERIAFATVMLEDVLAAVEPTPLEPTVLATDEVDVGVPLRIDDRPLDPLVNAEIDRGTPLAVVMADLPLVGPEQLERLLGTEGDVVVAPGQGGGTNALVTRDDAFRVDYHGVSLRDHVAIARERDLSVGVVDSFRIATDVDEADDFLEVLLHGEGRAATWLREAGFRLDSTAGRPAAIRDPNL